MSQVRVFAVPKSEHYRNAGIVSSNRTPRALWLTNLARANSHHLLLLHQGAPAPPTLRSEPKSWNLLRLSPPTHRWLSRPRNWKEAWRGPKNRLCSRRV